jgi:DNA-binding GntR family transcriptional regulator
MLAAAMLRLVDKDTLGAAHRELWSVVCHEIRRLIILGEVAPGERLVEADFAERLGVSRGPVRTALAELERVGLVTSIARRGTYVTTFSRADLDELFDVTCALERLAARDAAAIATPEQVSHLEELLRKLGEAQRSGDPAMTVVADLELHRELMVVSGNRRLVRLWNQISEEIRFVIAVTQRALTDVEWARYNLPIIEALRRRDPDEAERAVQWCFEHAHAKIRALPSEAFDGSTRHRNAGAA